MIDDHNENDIFNRLIRYFTVFLVLIGLYFTSFYNYLLFHSLAETFSIIIAGSIFIISWHSQRYQKYDFLIFLGIGYLFIGFLDFLHTLSYTGMNIFTDYDYYANQLWIATRFTESISLLLVFCFFYIKRKIPAVLIIIFYLLVTAGIILSIFVFKVFPICFIEGQGLTRFKVVSEYIICTILLAGIIFLLMQRKHFEKKIFIYMLLSFFFTIGSELAFTFYISNYGFSNLVGHYFKIFSFYFIYRALVDTGIKDPLQLIFRELSEKNEQLEQANGTKNKLFSVVSHDLRSTLGNLKNIAELLVDKSISSEDKDHLTEILFDSSKQTVSMLHNLLTWSRSQLNSISINPVEVELSAIVEVVLQQVLTLYQEKNITVSSTVTAHTRIKVDPDQIQIVLRNLITNAIKFTPQDGTIKIYCKTQGNHVEVFVEDNGVGIESDVVQMLLSEKVVQSSSGTNNEKGFGLGLKISKSFIILNKGEFHIKSTPGSGSTFSFTVPAGHKK